MLSSDKPKKTAKNYFTLKEPTPVGMPTLVQQSMRSDEKPESRGLRFNLGFAEFSYRGQGQFLYFYKRKGSLKSGVFNFDRRVALFTALIISLIAASATYGFWKKRQNAVALAIADTKSGIGGIGRLETGKIIENPEEIMSNLVQMEEDEKIKDQLMGVIEDKTKEEQEANKNTVQKLHYKVKRGDTLKSIARKYNVRPESISGSSRLNEYQDIKPGQTLSIPTRDGFYYVVKKNERLANILQAHKVTLDKFMAQNDSVNIDLLDVGEEIFLPGAKPIRKPETWFVPVPSRIITSHYGHRTFPRSAFHRGLDLKAFYVSARAAKSGVVTYSGWLGGYGNAIIIKHDDTYKTLYGHLSKRLVSVGQHVRRGQVVGRTGDTGYSFGPHLHFEISRNGENVNPRKFLKGLRTRSKRH